MKNYVIINGTNSNTLTGLMINELPPITKPEMRTQVEEIDGRDGDIITKLGYSAYDKTITIGLWGTSYDVDNIIKFFNKEGTIVFSNEPDKYYNFTQVNGFDIERLLKFKTASITFHCQPFKYPIIETQKIIQPTILTSDGESITINNTVSDSLKLSLKGNTSQASTPTPSSPIPVNVVSGDNTIDICGKNLIGQENINSLSSATGTYNGNTLTFTSTGTYKKIEWFIPVKVGDTFTFSCGGNETLYLGIFEYSQISTSASDRLRAIEWDSNITTNGKTSSFTIQNNGYLRVYLGNTSAITTTIENVMLEKGSTATTYEPYIGNTYPIYLGVENLFDKSNYTRLTGTINTNNKFRGGGANYAIVIPCKPNTTYTAQKRNDGDTNRFALASSETIPSSTADVDTILLNNLRDDNASELTITTGSTANYLIVQYYRNVESVLTEQQLLDSIVIEYGSKANHTSTTPIELCKIGTYQDYIYKTDKWYLHKEVGKVVLNGSEYLAYAGATSIFYTTSIIDYATSDNVPFSNYYTGINNVAGSGGMVSQNNNTISFINVSGGTTPRFYIKDTRYTDTISDLKTWLSSNNMVVYYALATPTDTEITNTTLINQLEQLKGAMSYEGQTNISQVNNDKPFIISASAVQSGTNEITINNIGNIYSKPLIALEGSGNVDIYLDDTQILKANVEDKMNIDINTLEAYNPDTSALLNRQVIGNYNSMTFQPGNNKLTINGSLNKATITNYTRWL